MELFQPVRWSILIVAAAVLGACAPRQSDERRIAEAQANSWIGPITEWKLPPTISRSKLQNLRDRAYGYCLREKPHDKGCPTAQDHSLFEYARSFAAVENFRSEAEPKFPYAIGHKQDPAAFKRVHGYCRSVYDDHGSDDARMLGPCMSAGVGQDFFGVTPTP